MRAEQNCVRRVTWADALNDVNQPLSKKLAAEMLEREAERLRKEVEDLAKPWMKPGWREQEPSIVERIAGLEDPEIARRIQDWDDWVKAGRPRPRPFPGAHRVNPGLVAHSIVSVQPMTGPVGGIAFYRPRYGISR